MLCLGEWGAEWAPRHMSMLESITVEEDRRKAEGSQLSEWS
jgi:hypothetical protein